MRTSISILLYPLVLASAACSNGNSPTQSTAPELAELRAKFNMLQERINSVEEKAQVAETQRSLEYVAAFVPTDTSYQTLRIDVGILAVSFADIQPFAGGSRVKLVFGNPTSARIQGLKLKLEWGGTGDIKSREHTLDVVLLPGSWVTANIPLESVPPSKFTGLRIRYLGHQGVYLNKHKDT